MLIQKRADAVGLFWSDWSEKREKKEPAPKRTPPERTWERPDYLPGLEEALAFDVPLMTDEELIAAQLAGEWLVWDAEVYPNYALFAFQSITSGKIVYFELTPDKPLDIPKLHWVLHNFYVVGFNSHNYDAPIAALALAGKTNKQLMDATFRIIIQDERPGILLRSYKTKALELNHVDLIEVAPLQASLKIYAGRLHAKKMQDLPFIPGTILSPEQIAITRLYCCNDLANTALLYQELSEAIHLREIMSAEYGVDVRSRSDAQIAESVIAEEIWKLNGSRPRRPQFTPGLLFKYNVPSFIKYNSATMNWVLDLVRNVNFQVALDGTVGMPEELSGLAIPIAGGVYRMGIGGLHSSEETISHHAGENCVLADVDVESYYPKIILNQGLYPQHLGPNFLRVYQKLVDRRLNAKHTGDKKTANSLKIVINGSFGKLGSPYSCLYSPHLLIQVTVTGQLALLMLIERLELAGIPVVSANTDGVVIECPKNRRGDMEIIVKQWEADTNFKTEETLYKSIFNRDVNNYFAVKEGGGKEDARFLDEKLGVKTKGAYCERGSAQNSVLSKNPTNLVCSDAVLNFLAKGIPLSETIRACKDIRRFVTVRSVKGGAVRVDEVGGSRGEYLGKAIRWYYAEGVGGEIVYASNGNKVPRSDGAKPLMQLPDELPVDIDYAWYEAEADKILHEVAYYQEVA